jgi:hypothetical protein
VHGQTVFKSHPKKEAIPKHVSPFAVNDLTVNQDYFADEDPYESTKFEMLKAKWLHDSRILYGEFKPS